VLEFDLEVGVGEFRLEASARCPTPGVVALYGASGAGKTTLAMAVAGLVRPHAGRICLDGEVLYDARAGIDIAAERRGIGYVFQDSRLFPHLGVAANLDYGARRSRGRTPYAERAEVIELLGLGALLERRVARLSGGERQRVALARALLAQPRLLVLDEPLAGVDALRRAEVLPYLERLRDRYAIPLLYVSHQYEEVLRLADHLLLLEAGRVLAGGTPVALAARRDLRRMLGGDGAGAVLEGRVTARDPATGLVSVEVGAATLRFTLGDAEPGARVRLLVPARDVLLATGEPVGLSVRNALAGRLAALDDEGADGVLATVDVGGALLAARITRAARDELALAPGQPVWALVKAASLHGRAFTGRSEPRPR
jgi:molybdate transport system ATP-binding protein